MSRLPIPHFINQIKTKLGFDRTLTASGEDVVDAVNKQSQQIGDLQPVIVTVTVDTGSVSMSAADQAKLTADMIKVWQYGDRTKLTKNLEITPGNGSASFNDARATSQTVFTIAFMRTSI